jgi:hypothetical protein
MPYPIRRSSTTEVDKVFDQVRRFLEAPRPDLTPGRNRSSTPPGDQRFGVAAPIPRAGRTSGPEVRGAAQRRLLPASAGEARLRVSGSSRDSPVSRRTTSRWAWMCQRGQAAVGASHCAPSGPTAPSVTNVTFPLGHRIRAYQAGRVACITVRSPPRTHVTSRACSHRATLASSGHRRSST